MNTYNLPAQYQGLKIDSCYVFIKTINSMSEEQIRQQRDIIRGNARKLTENIFTILYFQGHDPKSIAKEQVLADLYGICHENGISDHYAMLADQTHPVLRPLGPFPHLEILSDKDQEILQEAGLLFQDEFNARKYNDVDTREMIYSGKWRAIELMRDTLRLPASRFFANSLNKICQLDLFARKLDHSPAANKFKFKGIVNISRLFPGSIILPHFGINQSRLRIQIPINIPSGDCKIFCYDVNRYWDVDMPLILNDSYIHMVANNTDMTRDVVLIDIQHPDLININA